MLSKTANEPVEEARINAVIPTPVKEELGRWSVAEGRSERSHVALLLRKLVKLRQSNPDALKSIGLMDALAN